MKNLSIDIETYSSEDLTKTGVYRYVESPDFEILLFGYSADGGEVQVIDLAAGERIPSAVLSALEDESVIKWAFNASFERICLSRYLGYEQGMYLDPSSWHCSMVWSAYMGLPLSLEGVGAVLGLEQQKMREGKDLIRFFCKPCRPTIKNGGRTRNFFYHDEEKWETFKAYNKRDVETEMGMLRIEIESLQADAFDLALTGFDEKELSKLFDDGNDAKDDDFDVDEELKKPTFSKAGDVWKLGRHRLVCGDSTKPETYEVLMEGRKANLVLTDPPYNVNYEGTAGKIKNDNMASEKFFGFLFDAFSCMEKVMADDASIYVFHADTEGLNFRKAFDAAGFYLSGCCIWKKPSLVLGRSPYQWQHEPCLFGWKKNGKHQWYSDRKQTTIWEFEKSKKNGEHPTMKPIPLLCYPITNSTMSNTLVLDPFGGSGSTLIACEQTDRSCSTIELDEKFCDVIVNRYIELVGTAEKVSVLRDGKTYSYEEVSHAE